MGKLLDYVTGKDLEPHGSESRTITRGSEHETFPYVAPTSRTSLPTISETNALKIADIGWLTARAVSTFQGSYERPEPVFRGPRGADRGRQERHDHRRRGPRGRGR